MSNPYEPPNAPFGSLEPWPDKQRFLLAIAFISTAFVATVMTFGLLDFQIVIGACVLLSIVLGCFDYGRFDAYVGLSMVAFGALFGAFSFWSAYDTFHPLDRWQYFGRYVFISLGFVGILCALPYTIIRSLFVFLSSKE